MDERVGDDIFSSFEEAFKYLWVCLFEKISFFRVLFKMDSSRPPIRKVNLFCGWSLEEASIFPQGIVSMYYQEEIKFFQKTITNMFQLIERSAQGWNRSILLAPTTTDPETFEMQQMQFEVRISCESKILKFYGCTTETLLLSLVEQTLQAFQPSDLSCSWIVARPSDYSLQIDGYEEYICRL
jgi:c-di-AMP phosphodiesterase-like protein